MNSLWEKTANPLHFATLDEEINTDVLVIGGGICGVLCAYLLQQAGIDCVLVEAETVCGGVTKGTTAKLTAEHGAIYHKLTEKFGTAKARLYFEANQAALEKYRELAQHIDCDFEAMDAFVFSLDDREKMAKEHAALTALGARASLVETLPLPFPVAGAVKLPDQAQFHPLKFAFALAKDLHIYEHTRVTELIGTKARTAHGSINAKRIAVATHFPFLNKHGGFFLKLYQHRSYVLALNHAPQLHGMYVDECEAGFSFRTYGDLLLLGGGGHRTGKHGGNWQALREFAKKYYPNAEEYAAWATQDCISLDGMPYIGAYSAGTEHLYVATGFNKWGMTSSMVAATLLTDLLSGKKNPYTALFSPSRSILHSQLAVNAWESVTNLLTPTAKRCPHLGCALKWNPFEHTWDCPCHGSRFTEDGKLIDNPANGDLK